MSPGLYALVCAAAVLAGTYRMPLTAAILVFEVSRNYDLILPLLFSTVFAAFVVTRSRVPTFHPADADAARRYMERS
jgi:H+/Cl- antiporter ClcA